MKKLLLIFSIIFTLVMTGCSTNVGGTWHNSKEDFAEGISVKGTTVINNSGQYVGAVNGTTGAFSGAVSGTSFTGAVSGTTGTFSGAATFSGTTKVQATASSTLIIGGAGTGGGYTAGCIKLGDSASATATPVYITATGATITASTTRPAICSSN